jgi:hypothetical protein
MSRFLSGTGLVLPKSLKSIRRKRSVSSRRLQIAMAQIMGEAASVLALVGELVSRRMPQHMRMNWERKLSGSTISLDHFGLC